MLDAFAQPQSLAVLGGTSEIAAPVILELARRRCRSVVLAGRDDDGLARVADQVRAAGAEQVHTVHFDACEVSGAKATVDACFEAAGSLDMVLVAVGALARREDELDADKTEAAVSATYTWPVVALTQVAARMVEQGYGRIVVLSSVAAVRVRRANFVYGSAKAGLDAFSVGLGEALRASGVSVQVVRPGFVTTKMTAGLPRPPMTTTPERVAAAIVAGIESGDPVVWTPSALRLVMAVLRNAPQALWRRLPA